MKKLIVSSFAVIFLLFTVGAGVTVYYLFTTTKLLNELISLHQISDVPKELSLNIQKIKAYVYASSDNFAEHVDSIIEIGNRINETVEKCRNCHHKPRVEKEINEVEAQITSFEEQLSYLITNLAEGGVRLAIQNTVTTLGDKICLKVEELDSRLVGTVQGRTDVVMTYIRQAYLLLAVTLVTTFLFALFVARNLSKKVIEPIEQISNAALNIRDGKLGGKIDYQGVNEFGELINIVNEMSQALSVNEQRIESSLMRLEHLSQATLPFHTAHSLPNILDHVGLCMGNLIDVEQKGIMLVDQQRNKFVLYLSTAESPSLTAHAVEIPLRQVVDIFRSRQGNQIVINTDLVSVWPFGEKPEGVNDLKNLLLVWLVVDQQLIGALLAINRKIGNYSLEDVNVIEILANNIAVAFENIELYSNLQKRMEELQQTQRQLFEAEKLTALGTLAGGVAHDFNNILCGMIGHLALLKKKMSADSREYKILDTVEQAGFRAAGLTKQLLAFSRQEILEKKSVDLNSSIHQIVSLLSNTISKLITFKLELAANLPSLLGDASQLEQVVMNLVVNSSDALPNGGEISIKTEVVELDEGKVRQYSWMHPGRHVRLAVIDNGHGISKDVLPRIFEPFFTTKEFGKGTGLGLAIVYGITKSHNGVCEVDSIEGQGTRFSVYLPVSDRLIVENPLAVVDWQKCSGTILIVDDELFVSTMLSEYLEGLGCVIYIASNGEEGVKVFSDKRDEIDVVILDINMPVMDGKSAFDVMKKIKPDVKVIVSTGYGIDGLSRKIMEGGAQGFIQKPYSLDVIARIIAQVLGADQEGGSEKNYEPPDQEDIT